MMGNGTRFNADFRQMGHQGLVGLGKKMIELLLALTVLRIIANAPAAQGTTLTRIDQNQSEFSGSGDNFSMWEPSGSGDDAQDEALDRKCRGFYIRSRGSFYNVLKHSKRTSVQLSTENPMTLVLNEPTTQPTTQPITLSTTEIPVVFTQIIKSKNSSNDFFATTEMDQIPFAQIPNSTQSVAFEPNTTISTLINSTTPQPIAVTTPMLARVPICRAQITQGKI